MTRSILSGLLGLLCVATMASLPLACESGGVGDPCTPEDEYSADFQGFKVTEENIESRSFQCQTRICLVNHFQGRVSCPAGQVEPAPCGPQMECQGEGEECVEAAVLATECTDDAECGNGVCKSGLCVWETVCPVQGYFLIDGKCRRKVCHKPGSCQTDKADDASNYGKACCIPGTDTPVTTPVCGNCSGSGATRSAEQAVYCSCRCGVAEGQEEDPNFNFCECPDGFTCAQIRPSVGLGDEQITGKYCIKQDTEYTGTMQCAHFQGDQQQKIQLSCEGSFDHK